MPPLPPGALEHLLSTLPPEREDPYAHLEDLSADQLLNRRVEVSRQIKALERERQEIDAELQRVFPAAQLRHGIKVCGGWMLQERSRSRWEYAQEVQQAIKQLQSQAQRNGSAERLMSTYLCLSKEDSA